MCSLAKEKEGESAPVRNLTKWASALKSDYMVHALWPDRTVVGLGTRWPRKFFVSSCVVWHWRQQASMCKFAFCHFFLHLRDIDQWEHLSLCMDVSRLKFDDSSYDTAETFELWQQKPQTVGKRNAEEKLQRHLSSMWLLSLSSS